MWFNLGGDGDVEDGDDDDDEGREGVDGWGWEWGWEGIIFYCVETLERFDGALWLRNRHCGQVSLPGGHSLPFPAADGRDERSLISAAASRITFTTHIQVQPGARSTTGTYPNLDTARRLT